MTDLDAPSTRTPTRSQASAPARHARRNGSHPLLRWLSGQPLTSRHAAGTFTGEAGTCGPARAAGRAVTAAGVPLVLAAVVTASAPGWNAHTITSGETLEAIAARYGTTVAELVKANDLPGRGDVIRAGATLAVPAASAPIMVTEIIEHEVAAGESLWAIAAVHGVTIKELRAANDLGTDDLIRTGEVLKVPVQRPAAAPGNAAAAAAAEDPTHTVAAGDTVSALAKRYAVDIAAIREANGLDQASSIRVGQELRIPAASGAAPADGDNTFAGRTYPPEIVAAANRNRAELATRTVPSKQQTRALIVDTAQKHDVDPNLALAISYQESGWNQQRVSVANAIGAMQVLPGTAAWMSDVVGRDLDPLDTEDNVTAGVVLLKVLTRVAESEEQAIAAYYQGLRSVRENGPSADTVQYVANVQALKGRFADA
jgi:LysM repeat protein